MGVVDVGAHVGYYSCFFARAVGRTGSAYAFEPDPATFAILERSTGRYARSPSAILIVECHHGAPHRPWVERSMTLRPAHGVGTPALGNRTRIGRGERPLDADVLEERACSVKKLDLWCERYGRGEPDPGMGIAHMEGNRTEETSMREPRDWGPRSFIEPLECAERYATPTCGRENPRRPCW
jgi:hypothetical protein